MNIQLFTERLVLKVIDESYVNEVLNYYVENMEFLNPWEPERSHDFYTNKFHLNNISITKAMIRNGTELRLWIFKNSDTNNPIGNIGLSNIIRGCFQSCFLSYKLHKDEINKGYMTEALRKVIELAFNEMSLHRIEANIIPRNIASLKVVKKLGFINEGISTKYLKINGKWEDHIHMVKLNETIE